MQINLKDKKDAPLLSICIPTYNRPKEFERMFRGLLPQLTSETEVIIRDDSPNNLTKEIFDSLISGKQINYKYIKGEKIGLDAASLFLLEKANGVYVWWFSDDDEMVFGAISKFLEIVKIYPEIDYMWVNFKLAGSGQIAMNWPEDRFFKDRNEVMDLGANIGLISTMILKREEAVKFLPIAKNYIRGFSFGHLVPIFGILSGKGKFYFLRGPYILCHLTTIDEIKKITTKTGEVKNDGFQVYGIDFYKVVNIFREKFNQRSIKKILAVNFASLWRGMLVGWIGGWDTPKGKRWKMFKLYWNFPEFWIAISLFLMPLWVNKILYKIYKIFFSHRKWIFTENLKLFFRNKIRHHL